MRLLVTGLMLFMAGCTPFGGGVLAGDLQASQMEAKLTEMVRRAFLVPRINDGVPEQAIREEIAAVDRMWQIDLVLAKGDLMASAKPAATFIANCGQYLAESQGEPVDPACVKKRAAQVKTLQAAGIKLSQEEIEAGFY